MSYLKCGGLVYHFGYTNRTCTTRAGARLPSYRRCLFLNAPPIRAVLHNIGFRFDFKVGSHLGPIHWLAVLEQAAETSRSQIPASFELTVQGVRCGTRFLRMYDPRAYCVETPRLVIRSDLLGGVRSQQPRSPLRELVTLLATVEDSQRDGDIENAVFLPEWSARTRE